MDSSSKCKTVKLIPESITIDFIFVSYRSLKSLLRSDTREIVLEGRRRRIVSCDGIRITYWKNEGIFKLMENFSRSLSNEDDFIIS